MELQELKRALAEAASTAGVPASSNPKGRSAFAELIVEDIQPNRVGLEVFNAFMPTRTLKEGDQLVKRVRRTGHPVRTLVPGTTHLSDPWFPPREAVNYAIDHLITKLRMNVWELRRGELGTIEQFRTDMQNSLVDEIVARVYMLLGSVWDGTTSRTNYYDATSTGLTVTILDNMVETVNFNAA